MIDFVLHTEQTAPDASRPLVAGVRKQLGFVPNLLGVLAESPAAAQAYLNVSQLLDGSSLNAAERHVVLQTVNLIHECHYCVPAHAALAGMSWLGALDGALRGAAPLADPKLEALRRLTRAVVVQRGRVTPEAMVEFQRAGYNGRQVLEVIVGVALKTISNYAHHIAHTPVDAAFGGKAP
jgi:alkylhydroperoxidase family enzyme